MEKFSLYHTRRRHTPYPTRFEKIYSSDVRSFIIVKDVLPVSELERCNLVYLGHGMELDVACKEAERLLQQCW